MSACIWTGKRICFSLRSIIHYVLSVLHVNLWCRKKTKTDLMGLFNSRYIHNKQITAKKVLCTDFYSLRLQDFGKLTRSLRSIVRFPKSCNSWIKIRTSHFLWSNLYIYIWDFSTAEWGGFALKICVIFFQKYEYIMRRFLN